MSAGTSPLTAVLEWLHRHMNEDELRLLPVYLTDTPWVLRAELPGREASPAYYGQQLVERVIQSPDLKARFFEVLQDQRPADTALPVLRLQVLAQDASGLPAVTDHVELAILKLLGAAEIGLDKELLQLSLGARVGQETIEAALEHLDTLGLIELDTRVDEGSPPDAWRCTRPSRAAAQARARIAELVLERETRAPTTRDLSASRKELLIMALLAEGQVIAAWRAWCGLVQGTIPGDLGRATRIIRRFSRSGRPGDLVEALDAQQRYALLREWFALALAQGALDEARGCQQASLGLDGARRHEPELMTLEIHLARGELDEARRALLVARELKPAWMSRAEVGWAQEGLLRAMDSGDAVDVALGGPPPRRGWRRFLPGDWSPAPVSPVQLALWQVEAALVQGALSQAATGLEVLENAGSWGGAAVSWAWAEEAFDLGRREEALTHAEAAECALARLGDRTLLLRARVLLAELREDDAAIRGTQDEAESLGLPLDLWMKSRARARQRRRQMPRVIGGRI